MTKPTTYPLTVTRNRSWYGIARALILYAKTPSGPVKLGKVKHGKSVVVQVPHDATEVYGKMDWAKSETFDLTAISPGDTVYANLRFTFNPARNIGFPNLPCKFETVPR